MSLHHLDLDPGANMELFGTNSIINRNMLKSAKAALNCLHG